MTRPRAPTVKSAVADAVKKFRAARLAYGHGTASAEEEALFLVFETLKLPLAAPERFFGVRLLPQEAAAVAAIVETRIKTRRPAAYLVNKMYLQGLPFYVDERVIVPRSFIAELMAEGLPFDAPPGSVLDLCTGSGCLAVLAAHMWPEAAVDAVELSKDAAAIARRNIETLNPRVRLFEGDLFAPVKGRKYDLILTNPPYVTPGSMKALPQEYRHEPAMALAGGGADGMDIVRRILKAAPGHLTKTGGLLCEVGDARRALEKAFPRTPFLWLDTENSEGEVFWLARGDF